MGALGVTISCRTVVSVLCVLLGTLPLGAAEQVVEIGTRPGQRVRALLISPDRPLGSVILLAGGHGNLALTRDARIGWGKRNQLVRTRALYGQAGFATLVPDIAADLKRGREAKPRYRWSQEFAADIGALVAHLRGIASPVYLVGTSRAALSVATAAVRLSGPQRPDALVITSGMLMHVSDAHPSVQRAVRGLDRIAQPVLLVSHADDGCAFTQASSVPPFKALLTSAKQVDSIVLSGGREAPGDQCEALGHHGFFGQDKEVVARITEWLKSLR